MNGGSWETFGHEASFLFLQAMVYFKPFPFQPAQDSIVLFRSELHLVRICPMFSFAQLRVISLALSTDLSLPPPHRLCKYPKSSRVEQLQSHGTRYPLTQRFTSLRAKIIFSCQISMNPSDDEPRKRTARACDSCYKRKVCFLSSFNRDS